MSDTCSCIVTFKRTVEPTTGIEPVNLFLTKEVLYLLSYVGILKCAGWSGKRDSNPRPSAWKADALAN